MHQIDAAREREYAVSFAVKGRLLPSIFVEKGEPTALGACVDQERAVRVLIRSSGHSRSGVPHLLRHVQLASMRPPQPPLRTGYVANQIEEERAIERVRRGEQLPLPVDVEELVVLDRVAVHADVGRAD